MKEFTRFPFNHGECLRGLVEFRALLERKKDLEENADIKPFFEAHPQLALFIGSVYAPDVSTCDLLAFQYQLFGDFGCDLVVGDSRRHIFGFIEWEDGTAASLFRQQGRKSTPEWSGRLEGGFSQLVDWFWKLEDMSRTDEFEARFGNRHSQYFGLLVIGRDEHLHHPREQNRWQWRSRKVAINGRAVRLATYDQLYRDMQLFFEHFFSSPG